jgi:hypothetical protein
VLVAERSQVRILPTLPGVVVRAVCAILVDGRGLGVASAVCGIPHGWLNRQLVVVE